MVFTKEGIRLNVACESYNQIDRETLAGISSRIYTRHQQDAVRGNRSLVIIKRTEPYRQLGSWPGIILLSEEQGRR